MPKIEMKIIYLEAEVLHLVEAAAAEAFPMPAEGRYVASASYSYNDNTTVIVEFVPEEKEPNAE